MPPKCILYSLKDINEVFVLERTCNTDPCQDEEEKAGKISVEGILSNDIEKRYAEILNHGDTVFNGCHRNIKKQWYEF